MQSFKSPELLLRRAKTHIAEFEALEKRFVESKPYRQFIENDPENGDILHKASITADMPEFLPVILFDALNCMRSSLDHAVFDSSIVLTGRANPKYTKFPFGGTKEQAANELKRKHSEVPECMHPFLLAFGPFDPQNGGNKALYGLNEMRNGKIHRTLTEAAIAIQSIGFGAGYIGKMIGNILSVWDRNKRELTYMRLSVSENVHININISVFVAFDEGTTFVKQPAVATLKELLGIIEGIVAAIKAETARLSPHGSTPA